MSVENSLSLTQRIKEDWGTLKRFCEKNNININTYKVVVTGNGTSTRIVNILKKHKYIKNADELRKVA